MEIETNPPLPDPVAEAVRNTLNEAGQGPDPWWQAGIEDALEPFGE